MGSTSRPDDVTHLLLAWGQGEDSALERLTPLVYRELHRLARRQMAGERREHTLQATALVNEAYLRLVNSRRVKWQDRAHFFAISAQLMRRILVDHARRRLYQKRGAGQRPLPIDEAVVVSGQLGEDLVALDEGLTALSQVDSRKSEIVELRFFAGLTVEETAEVLKVSSMTVKREWRKAKAWLQRELSQKESLEA